MGEYYKDPHRYDDIIDMPHHQTEERPHMSLHDRAAQFSAFKALTGYEDALEETARPTDKKTVLDEFEIAAINEKLSFLESHLSQNPAAAITYFRPDKLKKGGTYLTDVGVIKKLDATEQVVIMENDVRISMADISAIDIELR